MWQTGLVVTSLPDDKVLVLGGAMRARAMAVRLKEYA
jgi:hypothetical protein